MTAESHSANRGSIPRRSTKQTARQPEKARRAVVFPPASRRMSIKYVPDPFSAPNAMEFAGRLLNGESVNSLADWWLSIGNDNVVNPSNRDFEVPPQ
jgi:hypothetical protein